MRIEIRSKYIPMILSLNEAPVPDGVTIEIIRPKEYRDGLSEPWIIAIITLALTVPVGVFVNWLSKKLIDKKSTKITINRKEIYFDEGEITRIIEESQKIEQN